MAAPNCLQMYDVFAAQCHMQSEKPYQCPLSLSCLAVLKQMVTDAVISNNLLQKACVFRPGAPPQLLYIWSEAHAEEHSDAAAATSISCKLLDSPPATLYCH